MILRSLLVLSLVLAPGAAFAHGEHDGHEGHGAPAVDPSRVVEVGGYRVEIASQPAPLSPGRRGVILARVSRLADGAPVSEGTALRAFPDPRGAARGFAPLAVLSALFTIAGIVLLNLPMGMRHGM